MQKRPPNPGTNTPSGSHEICRCFQHLPKLQVFVVKRCIINHFLKFLWLQPRRILESLEVWGPVSPFDAEDKISLISEVWNTTASVYKHTHKHTHARECFLVMDLTGRMKESGLLIFPAWGKSKLLSGWSPVAYGIVTKLIWCACRGAARSYRINSVME